MSHQALIYSIALCIVIRTKKIKELLSEEILWEAIRQYYDSLWIAWPMLMTQKVFSNRIAINTAHLLSVAGGNVSSTEEWIGLYKGYGFM